MPDKKLEPKQVEGLKKELIKIKETILHDIKNMTAAHTANPEDPAGEHTGHALHMADVATDMYDREFNLGLASNDRELLQKVEGALKRIEDQSFGVCSVCKKSIAAPRLKAIPYTETCLTCQEELEKGKR